MEKYRVFYFSIRPVEPFREMVLAGLVEAGFESFEETDTGLKAYIPADDWSPQALEQSFIFKLEGCELEYTHEPLAQINWNEEWERHYDPIVVDDIVRVRAPFHEAGSYPYELVIMPKMSFGTGHHHTTRLMLRALLTLDVEGRQVLDMGTGTGVLALFAERRGARRVDAVDNFEWAVDNTRENAERNQCDRVHAALGDAAWLTDQRYDVILANINRNVLLEDVSTYARHLAPCGQLLLSGYFAEDAALIEHAAQGCGLQWKTTWQEEAWVSQLFTWPDKPG